MWQECVNSIVRLWFSASLMKTKQTWLHPDELKVKSKKVLLLHKYCKVLLHKRINAAECCCINIAEYKHTKRVNGNVDTFSQFHDSSPEVKRPCESDLTNVGIIATFIHVL